MAIESDDVARRVCGWVPGIVFALLTRAACAGDPAELLPVVPASANALVAIDVESLLKTPLAERHHWADKAELEYAERPIAVPSEASAVAIAAALDPEGDLAIQWQVSVAQMTETFELPRIALWEGGYIDSLAGVNVAWTPSNCYILEAPEQRLAFVSPANRRLLSDWLKLRKEGGDPRQVSDYLRAAAAQANADTQIVMAIDLEDSIPRHLIEAGLERSQALFEAPAGRKEQWHRLLLGLRGVTLKVAVTNHGEGELRIDFNAPPPKDTLARTLVLEVLDNHQLHLEELEEWTIDTVDESLVLKGRFTPEGLRRVGSLLQLPTTKFSDLEGAEPAEPGSTDYTQRSQQYYRAVCALIDDLNKTLKQNRDNHAVWMERYGTKVDALPILNVDPELLDWGASIGETFRTMGLSQRAAGIRTGVRKSAVYGSYYYDANGYYYDRPLPNQVNEIRRQEQAQASKVRFESWKEIEDSRAAMRRRMTEKYGVEF